MHGCQFNIGKIHGIRECSSKIKEKSETHRITKVVRITTDQLYGLDFMEQIIVMRENDKPDSFSEADFKYLNKNDIEDLYYLCRNKVNYRETKLLNSLITLIKSRVTWERVHDFQLGIESYQIRVSLLMLLAAKGFKLRVSLMMLLTAKGFKLRVLIIFGTLPFSVGSIKAVIIRDQDKLLKERAEQQMLTETLEKGGSSSYMNTGRACFVGQVT
ncbi:hypothetical protein Tco_1117012, partial [Tanacetum coccineum]